MSAERIGNQAEQSQGRLHAREVGGRQILVELADHVVPHLRARAAQDQRFTFEREAGRLRDDRHHAVHHVLQVRLALDRLRTLAASHGKHHHNHSG